MHRRFTMILRIALFVCFFTGLLLPPRPVNAAIVAGYSEYFLPGSAEQLFAILLDNNSGVSGTLHNVVTIPIATDNVTVYYDHWENGYGTGVTGNDETYTASQGTVLTFVSDVPSTSRSGMNDCAGSTFPAGGSGGSASHCYDGRDRIYTVGGAVSVAQAFWPTTTGTVYANAWEVYPVKPYATTYTIPAGEDLFGAPRNYVDFQNVYVLVQATQDGTILNIDNKNPAPGRPQAQDIVNLPLNKGQVTQMYDVWAGTTVTANLPVQVQFIVGRQNANWDSRSHTAVPVSLWDTEYYSPVPSYGTDSTDVNLYIFNPNASSLTINYEDTTGSGSFTLPANSTRSYREMVGRYVPIGSGVYLASANRTTKFWAIGEYDSGSATRNWGFSLIPARTLTSEYIVSWSPGTSDVAPAANGSPVYISPTQNNTTFFVDYSPADGIADVTYTLNRLQVQKVRDPDNLNTGMRIWATAPFSIVWGEDAQYASTGNPYIDAGYTILPLNAEWIEVVLELEKTSNPTSITAAAGQVVSFTLAVDSTYPMSAVDLIDDLPSGWAYVNDSTTITLPDGTIVNGASANPTISGQKLTWSNVGNSVGKPGMNAGDTLTLTFQAQTIAVPGNYTINSGTVTATSAGETFTATDTTTVVATPPDLTVVKTNNLSGNALIGVPFTWTLHVANGSSSGMAAFADGQTILTDNLPGGPAYGAVTITNGAIPPSGPLSCSIAGTVLICSANGSAVTLPTGASFDVAFDVTPAAAGALSNPTGGLCAVDPNNVVVEGANEANNSCADTVTVAASTLSVVKNSSAGGTVNFGDAITYTIDIQNTGASTHNDIVVTDTLPAGTSYVPNSTQATGWLEFTYTYLDTFNPASYSNSNQGTAAWSSSWTETGDNGSAASGLISINSGRLRFSDIDTATIERPMDLGTANAAVLMFDWTRVNGDESVRAELWNGTGWDTVGSTNTTGASSGAIYHVLTAAQSSAGGVIRFSSNTGGWSAGEVVEIDNVQFEFDVTSATTTTKDNIPGGVNPDLNSGVPSTLVTGADSFILDPGDTMTVTYQVTVDNLSVGQTSILNRVSVKSDQQPQPLEASVTDNLPNSSISGQVRNDLDRDGPTGGIADAGDSSLAGATVTLYTDPDQDGDPADGVQVGSPIVTDATGAYSFTDIPTGYYVVMETDPADYASVMDKEGDTTTPGYNQISVALVAGSTNSGNDFLDVSSLGTLSGFILMDTDNDDTGDAPLAGVALTLYTDPDADGDPTDGAPVAFDVDPGTAGTQSFVLSQTDGSYAFANVPAGTYVIVETQPAGYLTVSEADTTADSPLNPADTAPATNRIPVNLAAGETDDGNTFVEEQPGILTGHVYYDRNADGSQDLDGVNNISGDADDEVNLANVSILISPASGAAFTVSTNASGDWTADVTPGSTTVDVDETDTDFTSIVPAGFSHTEGTDPQTVAVSAGATTATGNDGYGEYRPTADDDNPADMTEDSGATNIQVLGNDAFGGDGASTGAITITVPPGAAVGTAAVNDGGTSNDPTDDSIDFTPAANYNGPVSITYEICDADGDCDPAVVSFNVTPVDDVPVANNDAFTTPEDTTLNSDLKPNNGTAADVASGDGGNVWSKLTDPAHGTVTVNADGTFLYTPTSNYSGADSFTYQLCDEDGDCDPATVTITINPADDPVTADNESYATPEDTWLTVNAASGILPGDTYPDGFGTLTLTNGVTHGTLTLDTSDGSFTYLPDANYNGSDSFEYELCDVDGDCATGRVDITIDPVDETPTADDDNATTNQGIPVTINQTSNDNFGGDGAHTTTPFVLPDGSNGLLLPSHGSVSLNDNGTPLDPGDDRILYTPSASYYGTDTFEYQICDLDGDCDPATVTITIQGNPQGLSKTIVDSNQTATTNPDVAIGEIVTYQVSVNVPPGTFANARLVDTMDRGLSYMNCVGITDNGLQTSQPGGFSTICSNPTVDDAGGTTTVDVGRRVTFDLGTLTNNTGADQTLVVTYRAVILDSAGNIAGTSLNNHAEWTWAGGSLGPINETVVVVEPDLSILTTANTLTASVGSEITIALTIQHTTDSEANAYDAIVTDTLPAELQYIPGSLECTSGAQDAAITCSEAGGTITAQWSNFARSGGDGRVTFRVTVVSLPAGGITNTANVAWTSLPGDVSVPQNSNVFSTERDYDPGSPINIYGNSHSLRLGVPASGGSNNNNAPKAKQLPSTGFAPNRVTSLTDLPREAYTSTNGVTIEIPSLGVKIPVVGVPFKNADWNVTWLGEQAGWLEGSAFPSWKGNSVITSHVYLANGLPGPFVNLNTLKYGEKVIIHVSGQKYIYEVRSNEIVSPRDTSAFKHEEKAWLTLVTCKEYDEKTNTYRKRVIIRAVLVSVAEE